MDLATLLGIVICFVMVIFGIVYDDGGVNFSVMLNFLNAPSAIITFGGAFCAVLIMNSVKDFVDGLKSIGRAFKMPQLDTIEIIKKIIDLSNIARKEGLLSLEEAASDIDDEFLKKGILLIVDGTDPELVRAIMETEMGSVDARHKQKVKFWNRPHLRHREAFCLQVQQQLLWFQRKQDFRLLLLLSVLL